MCTFVISLALAAAAAAAVNRIENGERAPPASNNRRKIVPFDSVSQRTAVYGYNYMLRGGREGVVVQLCWVDIFIVCPVQQDDNTLVAFVPQRFWFCPFQYETEIIIKKPLD